MILRFSIDMGREALWKLKVNVVEKCGRMISERIDRSCLCGLMEMIRNERNDRKESGINILY